jgi:hypothetical protein
MKTILVLMAIGVLTVSCSDQQGYILGWRSHLGLILFGLFALVSRMEIV